LTLHAVFSGLLRAAGGYRPAPVFRHSRTPGGRTYGKPGRGKHPHRHGHYCKDYLDYVYVNAIGQRIKPGYLTQAFPEFLEKRGMRRIRFHDLRHSCATLNRPLLDRWAAAGTTVLPLRPHLENKLLVC
jgi:hypothetical protein